MPRFGIQRNEHMSKAIGVLRAGQSRGQQNQAFVDKLAMAGAQAGIGAVGHAIEADRSFARQENNKKRDVMADAISSQTKLSRQQDGIRRDSAQYAAPDYAGPSAEARPMPSWLTEGGEATPEAIKDAADQAIARQAVNTSAAGANIGGYMTSKGAGDLDASAGAQARDMATAKEAMNLGGMMNSLPRTVPR